MSLSVEQRIRDRAYAIWQEQGCPDGCDYEHWLAAEREVAAATTAPKAAKKPSGKAPKASADAPAAAGRKPRARKVAVTA